MKISGHGLVLMFAATIAAISPISAYGYGALASQAGNAGSVSAIESIKEAVLQDRSDMTGSIGIAPVGTSGLFVVYVRSRFACGSGGCRPQVWKFTDHGPQKVGEMGVGHLPIVLLPDDRSGSPVNLGITQWDSNGIGYEISAPFDASQDTNGISRQFSMGTGTVILSEEMLEEFGPDAVDTSFPDKFRGRWSKRIDYCDDENTTGFTIKQNQISYYEGWENVLSISNRDEHVGGSGLAEMVDLNLAYEHADGPDLPRPVRLTLIEDTIFWLADPSASLPPGEKFVRCPAT